MKTIVTTLLLFLGLASVQGAAKDGFISMFDGKTLKGWEATPVKIAPAWTVQDGMIVGNGDKGRGYLTYTANKNVADLELKFSYRFPGKGNSGTNIRAIPDKTRRRDFQSYHADLGHLGIGKNVMGAWDFHTPGRREHRCFRGDRLVIAENDQPTITPIKNALTAADIRKGDWNHVHIIVEGNRFQLFINGKLSSEFTEHLPQAKRLQSGMIQLQLHDPGMMVQFRDLQLKVLK
ncbi:MAG: 3-keto-disaccharide hydrolase [Limisphaerales bacterium]